MLLVLNLPLAGLWVRLLAIPRPLLYAGILVLAGLGTYSISGSVVDLVVLYLLGALGFVMRRFDIPVAPAVVGVTEISKRRMTKPRAPSRYSTTRSTTEPLML